MSNTDKPLSREERLAQKLRENLLRRKSQARAKNTAGQNPEQAPLSKGEPKS